MPAETDTLHTPDSFRDPNRIWRGLLTTALGAAAGLALWYFVGCQTGACLLTSTWWSSMIYGGLMAHLVRSTW